MKLCLNMIVKNEAARITRALASVAQFIDCYAITDTGSEDDTPKVIKEYFAHHHIPGIISHAPFVDWSQARNNALIAARSIQKRHGWDWALLIDADMELVVKDLPFFKTFLDDAHARGALSLDMEQQAGTLHYANRRLISSAAKGSYNGVTHEYLDVDSGGMVPHTVAFMKDHADGANRPEKFKRDIRLLLAGLEKEPDNSRYFYYLAQSYRDAGDLELAKHWYRKRVAAGGWAEEQWSAQMNLAHCYKDQKDEDGFIREMLIAYNMRPTRAESMYDLANYFRNQKDKQSIAAMFAEVGMTIPRTNDLLFVNDFAYMAGLKEEFAITGFYNEAKRPKAFKVCSDLSLQPGPYESARASARYNLYWYLPKLEEYCPSFKWRNLNFTPPENWVAMNPSITNHGTDDRLFCNVRCVNYRIDNEGRYLIRRNDGNIANDNPIETRNFLLDMGMDPMTDTKPSVREIMPPSNMPCEFPAVMGFEDMRLFSFDNGLHFSSTVRQIHWDGNCEQVMGRLMDVYGATVHTTITDWKRMLPEVRATEKNWAPIPLAGPTTKHPHPLLFMHRPGTTVDTQGRMVTNNPPPYTTDIISGGSQLIPFAMGYLALVHTANQIPNKSTRYYFHRWAVYDTDFKLVSLSLPFVFHEKEIEFAAGLARHPTQKGVLVISYGFHDNEARVATITETEVARFIWSPSK